MTLIAPELREAARAICRTMGLDPDAATSSAYAAPPQWEHVLHLAKAVSAVFAESLRARAEIARAASMISRDWIEAERLKARADALHEAADALGEKREGATVIEFRKR